VIKKMSINKFGASQQIREMKQQKKQKEESKPPEFTEEEIEVLRIFKEECEKRGIDSEALASKLAKN
jgi:DNA-binding NarL/FixJ family response regulator